MAKRAGLRWDATLGAEVARHYKPQPAAYLTTAELLGLVPAQCVLVAVVRGHQHALGGYEPEQLRCRQIRCGLPLVVARRLGAQGRVPRAPATTRRDEKMRGGTR